MYPFARAELAQPAPFPPSPEIYRTTQKDTGKEKTALVRLEYSVRIAGSQTQRGNFIYKVTFNEESKKFTTIENLGEENQ